MAAGKDNGKRRGAAPGCSSRTSSSYSFSLQLTNMFVLHIKAQVQLLSFQAKTKKKKKTINAHPRINQFQLWASSASSFSWSVSTFRARNNPPQCCNNRSLFSQLRAKTYCICIHTYIHILYVYTVHGQGSSHINVVFILYDQD